MKDTNKVSGLKEQVKAGKIKAIEALKILYGKAKESGELDLAKKSVTWRWLQNKAKFSK